MIGGADADGGGWHHGYVLFLWAFWKITWLYVGAIGIKTSGYPDCWDFSLGGGLA